MTAENKKQIIQQIHQMGFFISQNIEQGRLDSWIDLNLTMSQLKGLIYIEYQRSTCPRDLSRTLKMAKPNITSLVDFLVQEGLVSRKQNPEDRRLWILTTTPKGKKLLKNLRESVSSEISGYLMQLSLDQLHKLAEGISPLVVLMQPNKYLNPNDKQSKNSSAFVVKEPQSKAIHPIITHH